MHEEQQIAEKDQTTLEIFLVINKINYPIKSNSLIQAIEFCYKSFSTLGLEYSLECKHVWIFLATYFYRVNPDKFKKYVCVKNLKDWLVDKVPNGSLMEITPDQNDIEEVVEGDDVEMSEE